MESLDENFSNDKMSISSRGSRSSSKSRSNSRSPRPPEDIPLKHKRSLGLKIRLTEIIGANSTSNFSSGSYDSEASCRTRQERRDAVEVFMNSRKFSMMIGFLITMNTVLMGVELDQHALAKPHDAMYDMLLGPREVPQKVFDGFELFFLLVFGMELLGRMFVYRTQLVCEMATYIDFIALMPAIFSLFFQVESGQQLTLLRIVRLVKLSRLLRIFRLSKELNMLAKSMASALRALVWIGLLLFITVYCSAIVCTTVIGQNSSYSSTNSVVVKYEAEYGEKVHVRRFWGSMMRSMLTLFQIFTLDGWAEQVRPIVETHQPWMLIFFICFTFTTSFGLLNLLVGTIVDRAMHIAKEHEEEKERLMHDDRRQMLLASVRLFSLMDNNGNGVVTPHEITSFLDKNDIQEVLEKEMIKFNIHPDYSCLVEICRKIALDWFESSDGNHSPSDSDGITVEEFAGAAARLQGVAQSRDMLTVLMTTKTSLTRLETCELGLDRLQDRSEKHEEKLDRVLHILSQLTQTRSAVSPSCAATLASAYPLNKAPHDIQSSRSSSKSSRGTPAVPPSLNGHPPAPDPTLLQPFPDTPDFGRRVTIQEDEQVGLSAYLEEGASTAPKEETFADGVDQLRRRQSVSLPDLSKSLHTADRRKSINPTLRMDRTVYQRHGTNQISGLLHDFKGFDDLLKTETASAMRQYSNRGSLDAQYPNRSNERNGSRSNERNGSRRSMGAIWSSKSTSSDEDGCPSPDRSTRVNGSTTVTKALTEGSSTNSAKRSGVWRLSMGIARRRSPGNADGASSTVQVLPCAVDPM